VSVRVATRPGGRRLGGTEGNEHLTSLTAVVLTALLLAEGVTILRMGDLRTEHMFIGLVLIGPVLLKLASTGYRFVRYYGGARTYREKGPPLLPLRVLAPVLVFTTVVVFASGVGLLAAGDHNDTLMLLHKAGFIGWSVCFGVHFLAHLPRMMRSVATGWTAARAERAPGSGWRGALLAASVCGGFVLAFALLSRIEAWHGHHGHDDG
jgi:hypothetical protein